MSRVFNQCPDCSVDLPDGAMKCACGWKKRGSKAERPEREPIPCAHSACAAPAILSLKLRTGWADLCRGHHLFHVQQEADEFCARNELVTRAQQAAFYRSYLRRGRIEPAEHWRAVLELVKPPRFAAEAALAYFEKRGGAPQREPGQDEEERAA